jgi:hypothetical protein
LPAAGSQKRVNGDVRGTTVARAGLIDMRTQAEVLSAHRTDTPMQFALVDVPSASNDSTQTYFGGADRRALRCMDYRPTGSTAQ